MSSEVQRKSETIRVTEVTNVQVTDIVDSDNAGLKVRAVRVYGSQSDTVPILELQVESSVPTNLKIATPVIAF